MCVYILIIIYIYAHTCIYTYIILFDDLIFRVGRDFVFIRPVIVTLLLELELILSVATANGRPNVVCNYCERPAISALTLLGPAQYRR